MSGSLCWYDMLLFTNGTFSTVWTCVLLYASICSWSFDVFGAGVGEFPLKILENDEKTEDATLGSWDKEAVKCVACVNGLNVFE